MERKELIKKATALFFIRRRRLIRRKLTLFNSIFNLLLKMRTTPQLLETASLYLQHRNFQDYDPKNTFWECDVPNMEDNDFQNIFRVSRQSFKQLCEHLKCMEKENTILRPFISLEKKVAISLYTLGSTVEYVKISELFGVGIKNTFEILMEFSNAVCKILNITSYPPTEEQINNVVEGFAAVGFPQCFGVLDAFHIAITPPKEDANDYYNRKGWCSSILLAACDHRCKFTYFNTGAAGGNNPTYIFENSSLKRFHEYTDIFKNKSKMLGNENVPVLLIGGSAFRLSSYVMKSYPYKPNQTQIEETFNRRLNKCRRFIENAFRQLKARFRRLEKGVGASPEDCNVIINACCLLHNFLKEQNDEVTQFWMDDYTATTKQIQPNCTTKSGEDDEQAKAIRDGIALSFQHDAAGNDDLDSFGNGSFDDDDEVGEGSVGETSGIGTVGDIEEFEGYS